MNKPIEKEGDADDFSIFLFFLKFIIITVDTLFLFTFMLAITDDLYFL